MMGFASLYPSYGSHRRPVPRDAGTEHVVHRPVPPPIRENLYFRIAAKSLRLNRRANRTDVDHAIAHHAAVVEDVFGRHQPVADVEGEQALLAGAGDLRHQLRIPPDMIDVE